MNVGSIKILKPVPIIIPKAKTIICIGKAMDNAPIVSSSTNLPKKLYRQDCIMRLQTFPLL
jgi:hypothetical protein